MRFFIPRDKLLKPLQTVASVVERRKTLPILSNILIKVNATTISLVATDLEVELLTKITIEKEIDRVVPGTITIPGKKLMDICRALPEEQTLEFRLEEQRMVVQANRSRFVLSTLPFDDFPEVENEPGLMEFSIKQGELRYLIERTHFAIAQQDVRYFLNGLLFEITNQKVNAVATDGHRLAVCTYTSSDLNPANLMQIIIPRKAILELAKLLDRDEEKADLVIGKSHVRVATDDFTFTSKLIDGKFPDYSKVIPKKGDKNIVCNKEQLKQVLNRASILSNEKYRGVRLQLRTGFLRALANSPEQEEAEVEFEIDYEGADLDIGFNVTYLLDVLNTIQGENISLSFSDPNSSVLITSLSDSKCIYVVMPMRL